MTILCVPPVNACSHASPEGHHCGRSVGHAASLKHACFCGWSWEVDRQLERAIRAYLAFYLNPYTDAPEHTSLNIATAACLPPESPWRRVSDALEDRA